MEINSSIQVVLRKFSIFLNQNYKMFLGDSIGIFEINFKVFQQMITQKSPV